MAIEFRLSIPGDSTEFRFYRAKAVAHRDGESLAKAWKADTYQIARVIDGRVLQGTSFRVVA